MQKKILSQNIMTHNNMNNIWTKMEVLYLRANVFENSSIWKNHEKLSQ